MAKRFPVPEFDYEDLRGRAVPAPERIAPAAAAEIIAAGTTGAHAVAAPDALFERFSFTGEHRAAVLCVPPAGGARMVGRSHAWYVQRVVALSSLDADTAMQDWKTPRPMNTRLGPADGVQIDAPVYLLFGHRFGDHWIANRLGCENEWRPDGAEGFRVVSADDDERDDFHAAVVAFSWSH